MPWTVWWLVAQGVEALLRQLCVRWLVLPSIRTVLPMWRYSFSFIPLTLEEQAALEPYIVSPGKQGATLVSKFITLIE
jgi:hypothetical protein